jgi:hypothetical protein
MRRSPPSAHARRKRLGLALRTSRAQAGFDLDGAAEALGWPPQRLNRLEQGLATVRRVDAKDFLSI